MMNMALLSSRRVSSDQDMAVGKLWPRFGKLHVTAVVPEQRSREVFSSVPSISHNVDLLS